MLAKWFASDTNVCGYIRGEVPARIINRDFPNHRVEMKTHVWASDFINANVMIFQRAHAEDMLHNFRFANQKRIKTVYDLDDDMLNVPANFEKPFNHFAQPETRGRIVDFLSEATMISASTETLALSLRERVQTPISVIENSIESERWLSTYKEPDGCVTIGWMASKSHRMDVPLIEKSVGYLLRKYPQVKFHFIGWIDMSVFGIDLNEFQDRILIQEWVDIKQLPQAMANMDIGLCPIIDNKFNRSKSNIKFLQYGILGSPAVVSPLPPYQSVQDFAVVAETPDDWVNQLEKLVVDDDYRRKTGDMARQFVINEYDSEVRAVDWVRAYDRIMRM